MHHHRAHDTVVRGFPHAAPGIRKGPVGNGVGQILGCVGQAGWPGVAEQLGKFLHQVHQRRLRKMMPAGGVDVVGHGNVIGALKTHGAQEILVRRMQSDRLGPLCGECSLRSWASIPSGRVGLPGVSRQEKRSARHVLRPTTPGEITHHFSQACHSAGSFAPFAGLRRSHGEPARRQGRNTRSASRRSSARQGRGVVRIRPEWPPVQPPAGLPARDRANNSRSSTPAWHKRPHWPGRRPVRRKCPPSSPPGSSAP